MDELDRVGLGPFPSRLEQRGCTGGGEEGAVSLGVALEHCADLSHEPFAWAPIR